MLSSKARKKGKWIMIAQQTFIWRDTYTLLKELDSTLMKIDRKECFTWGDDLRHSIERMLIDIQLANESEAGTETRCECIRNIRQEVNLMQVIVRMFVDNERINFGRYNKLSELLIKIGEQATGWLKKSKKAAKAQNT